MGSHVTRYETKDGKTRRAKNPPPAPQKTTEPKAAPKNAGADNSHAPGSPAKEGA
jgi:hypothetical protein